VIVGDAGPPHALVRAHLVDTESHVHHGTVLIETQCSLAADRLGNLGDGIPPATIAGLPRQRLVCLAGRGRDSNLIVDRVIPILLSSRGRQQPFEVAKTALPTVLVTVPDLRVRRKLMGQH
jgi:hypothetical protein